MKAFRRLTAAIAIGIVPAVQGCGTAPPDTTARPASTSAPSNSLPGGAVVPPQYRATYAELAANIVDLQNQDGAGSRDPGGPRGGPVIACGLELADGNRGRSLLAPTTLPRIVQVLDRFEQLGVEGVMLEVGYPLLLPSFPDSSAYLRFYSQVAADIAARHMILSIELNPVFRDPQISSVHPDYRGLTVTTYAAQQRHEAQIVIDDLHPKYLTVLDEPSTFAYNLGLPIAHTGAVVSLLDSELSGLDRRGTMIGAGIGTWEDPTVEKAIATETSVDYLSVHVYPTGPSQIATLNAVTSIAAAAGKPLVMDETWLSKSDPSGRPGVGNADVEGKIKNWSFWEPLDARFLDVIVRYARDHGISLVSPFSSDLFFGYVAWSPQLEGQSKAAVNARTFGVEVANLDADRYSTVGEAYGMITRARS